MATTTKPATRLQAGPPARVPLPVEERMHIVGSRVIIRTRHGAWKHDQRAVSNPYEDETTGKLMVDVMDEGEWYLLARTGACSDGTLTGPIQTHRARAVWVEVPHEAFSMASALM